MNHKLMKIFFFALFFFLIYSPTSVFALIKTKKDKDKDKVPTTLSLNIEQQHINFNFTWFNDYVNGLGGANGKYSIKGQVTSNVNWQLSCKAKGKFKQIAGKKKISLNNVGVSVYCENMTDKVNKTLNSPLPLSKGNKTLLYSTGKIKTNKKAKKDKDKDKDSKNKVITDDISLIWEMGTRNGKMNKKNLFQQNLNKGAYSVDIEFILIEKL